MTVQLPVGASHKEIILLKENEKLKPSEHIKIVRISPTTAEIQIIKAKPDDEGKYSVSIDSKEQPLIQLKVIPKSATRQTMDIPQTTFNEGETLIIKCQIDSGPEETFEFLRNEKPLIPDDRIVTTVENNTYTIQVKNLKPKEDEGVYTLKSKHLILDTPSITVTAKDTREKPTDTQNVFEEIEEETIVIDSVKKPEVVDIEIVEKEEEKVSLFLKNKRLYKLFQTQTFFNIHRIYDFNTVSFSQLPEVTTTTTKTQETITEEKRTIETSVAVEEAAPVKSPTITEIIQEQENLVIIYYFDRFKNILNIFLIITGRRKNRRNKSK
jgi:hypothetical protein